MSDNRGATTRSNFELRVTSAFLKTALAVLAVACLAFLWQELQLVRSSEQSNLQTVVELIVDDMADDLDDGDLREVQKTLTRINRMPRVESAEIVLPNSQVIASYLEAGPKADSRHDHDLLQTVPIVFQGKLVGSLKMKIRPASIMLVAPTIAALFAMLFFGASGCALFIGHSFARRVAKPVDDLSKVMSDIATTDKFEPLAFSDRTSVFPRLIDAFNRLISHINDRDRDLRASLEALTLARDAADQANSAKSLFLANVSHEIRTPLNGIAAMAELMEIGDLSDVQRERLVVMRQSTETLSIILNDLLDLSKIEAGKMTLDGRAFDLADMARSVERSFAAVAEGKGLAFAVQVDESAQGSWNGDPDRLRQICNNLVSNAIKFTAHGRVTLDVKSKDGGGIELSVTDTGIGIDLDKAHHLFESFVQADASTTRKYGGTGLGLSICRELAELMGGTISVASQVGAGARFIVAVPLTRAAKAVSIPQPEETPPNSTVGRKLRILAADDNATNRKVVGSILSVLDVDLFQAHDGHEALENFKAARFDLVLMDIQMPVMDGVTASRKIREFELEAGIPRTPILALSANAMEHQILDYLQAGMDGHVSKPIEIARLFSAIHEVLEVRQSPQDLLRVVGQT